jgi:DNA-binding transcriptional MocR family regulator
MSFQAMTWAVGQKLPAKEKLVLLMLANYCNSHTGQCNPSHNRLAEECGMSKNTLLTAIKSLEGKKHLTVIRKKIGDVNLPNQYELNLDRGSADIELGGATSELGSAIDALGGSAVFAPEPVIIKPVIEPKRTITTKPPENFGNSELKLTAEQSECFEWAKKNDYWHLTTSTIEEFLLVYNKPKGGMRKQFQAYKKSTHPIKSNGGNHAAHQLASQKLSAGDRIRVANGLPLNDELNVIDSTATHVD